MTIVGWSVVVTAADVASAITPATLVSSFWYFSFWATRAIVVGEVVVDEVKKRGEESRRLMLLSLFFLNRSWMRALVRI